MIFQAMEVVTPDRAKKWHSVTVPPSGGMDPDHFEFEREFLAPSEFLNEMTSLLSLLKESEWRGEEVQVFMKMAQVLVVTFFVKHICFFIDFLLFSYQESYFC